ncbi:uncharacterized protein Dana_GF27958 [Drosophila ananassae]|uniref:Mab-21-like nucleotidyltransferase domain-containing protein n=1 Tax=Drosophila ananassae TaxID=7217 RepID=A0A0N8NZZ9_DROAN|nr:uncharacterized protein LOC26515367 [Drosophila ananassae]KPU75732.1 uncharacterized protein Dana_GF27958 [Drosophila ananassae]
MSSIYEEHLEVIVSHLNTPPTDHGDFYRVRNFVINLVRDNRLVKSTCKVNSICFGSSVHGIRMYNNDEYDVMIELEFPFWSGIFARPDQYRPGMVHLDFKDLPFNQFTQDMLLDHRGYLLRSNVQTWMQSILLDVSGRQVWGEGRNLYYLRYKPGQCCHTIIAQSDSRTFSIDFVPAIKVMYDGADLQVVPKYAEGPKRSHNCTFMVTDILEEVRLFENGGELVQEAVMLLMALCETKGLPKIRKYHLVTCAILVMEYDDFYNFTLADVFINLLGKLIDALADNSLPYLGYMDRNLLSNFKPHQIDEYIDVLNSAYSTLKTYPYQYKLSFDRCSEHFL